jgi:hypothetical protein
MTGGSFTGGATGIYYGAGSGGLRLLGVKCDAGTGAGYRWINSLGYELKMVGCDFEIPSGTAALSAVLIDGNGTSPSGYRNQIIGCTFAGNSSSGQYGIDITANAHNTEIIGLTAVNFTAGQNLRDLGVNTMIMRTPSGQGTVPWASIGGVGYFVGAGSPEGVVTAPVGSEYSRTDGGAGTCKYVKESGSSNTGWVGK